MSIVSPEFMMYRNEKSRKDAVGLKLSVLGLAGVCLLLLFAALFWKNRSRTPIPKGCTRIEIEYRPSALEYFSSFTENSGFLSSGEMERLRSNKPIITTDLAAIEDLRHILDSTPLLRDEGAAPNGDKYIRIRCYRDDKQVVSLVLYEPNLIVADDGRRFRTRSVRFDPGGLNVKQASVRLQGLCARNLCELSSFMSVGTASEYPPPTEWCDVVSEPIHRGSVRWRERVNIPSPVVGRLSCPSGGEGKCHYAMNPACKPDSPPNTVLLFETKAGWNQHGGPEMFTFENHVPSGGCVLLNDGTVKFIRTEEELKQLRWK